MSKAHQYAARFARVFAFIDQHLDEALTVEQLSQVAGFSKYHFHRQFCAYTAMNVMRYVQWARLKRASYQLVYQPQQKIIEITLNAQFENPESFSRAFKKSFGQTPTEFRQQAAWTPWNERFKLPNLIRMNAMNVKIIDLAAIKVALLEHRGPAELVNNTATRFIEWRKTSGLSPVKTSQTFGIAHDDPNTTEPAQFRFDICGSILAGVEIPANPQQVKTSEIPAGRCAVVRHLGSHDQMEGTIYDLFHTWLPESGEQLRDFPLFFHYINLISETPEHELITDIYLPLQ